MTKHTKAFYVPMAHEQTRALVRESFTLRTILHIPVTIHDNGDGVLGVAYENIPGNPIDLFHAIFEHEREWWKIITTTGFSNLDNVPEGQIRCTAVKEYRSRAPE